MSVEIVFETHSLTEDNESGIATGWLPGRLSERGRRLATELGERRRGDDLAAVFTSDLARAVETAELALGATGVPIYRDARLRECNYGTMNGMPTSQLEAERLRRIDEPFPGGESWRQAAERVEGFLEELAETHDGERVLVVLRARRIRNAPVRRGAGLREERPASRPQRLQPRRGVPRLARRVLRADVSGSEEADDAAVTNSGGRLSSWCGRRTADERRGRDSNPRSA